MFDMVLPNFRGTGSYLRPFWFLVNLLLLLHSLLCRHFQDETLFLIFIYFRNQFDVVLGKSAVSAGADRISLNMGQ